MAAFEDLSARELATAIRRKEISAREALDAHYARIDAINPALNAVVTQCRERAYDEAARADDLTTSGADLPPLHGVPSRHGEPGFKGRASVRGGSGWQTSCGSRCTTGWGGSSTTGRRSMLFTGRCSGKYRKRWSDTSRTLPSG
jgi:Asp-tRNA(Asn)/Glu-tRNA(Gln) amidotransferase A subunit family amidase